MKMKIDILGKELIIIRRFFPWDIFSYREGTLEWGICFGSRFLILDTNLLCFIVTRDLQYCENMV